MHWLIWLRSRGIQLQVRLDSAVQIVLPGPNTSSCLGLYSVHPVGMRWPLSQAQKEERVLAKCLKQKSCAL